MHVYLREDLVELEMREVDAEGLIDEESDLIPVAFYVLGNERPSFRALLPASTVAVLEEATLEPVRLGVLAEEPEAPGGEIRAMVGLSMPYQGEPDEDGPGAAGEEREGPDEPWKVSAGDPEAWRGDRDGEDDDDSAEGRTLLLAFAPLVRLKRKFPHDFAEELADLLESALAGDTKPSLQARVDQMLDGL